jgi:hypothetical protein
MIFSCVFGAARRKHGGAVGQPVEGAGGEARDALRSLGRRTDPSRATSIVVRARDEEVAVVRARATRRTICDMVAVAS